MEQTSDPSISDSNQIKELLEYLGNIKSYEQEYIRSEASTIAMIWGVFIFIAGMIDLNIALFVGYSPHFAPWFLCIFGGYLAQQIIASQPLLFDRVETDNPITRNNASKEEIALTFIFMAFTIVISAIDVALVMPYIGLVFGTANLMVLIKNNRSFGSYKKNYFLAFSFWISSILSLIGTYLISYEIFVKLTGFIFGIIVGPVTFFIGYKTRKLLKTNSE